MGFVQTEERRTAEVDEFRRELAAHAGIHRRKDDDKDLGEKEKCIDIGDDEDETTLVCVTSGLSYLGIALVNHLLLRGYSVRITVDNPEEMREMETTGEMSPKNQNLEVVMAKLTDMDSLVQAFEGCRGVFHTSAFVDPAGHSGYTKSMAGIEVKVTEIVMEACARTSSVQRCVFTSSLAACVWQDLDNAQPHLSLVINDRSWNSESLCTDKKLWYALGKMRAEKTAWRVANKRGLKLTTICPALITGREFCRRNPTATIAYLKGAQEMYSHGVLATVDVVKLAEAHECVFKAMNRNACGRYICFDKVIECQGEAEKLAKEINMPKDKICVDASNNSLHRFQLSSEKLRRLMSRPVRCHNQY
ncbi:hypothetical protein L6164_008922 [Bauhinia variegata]|uniref:Uncharacterized protein n=1 Tax=Bauhinia variegata TaxID=167791 RepID=A0ACB9PJD6_BAUVA|nr:hypothetical protein L6164_008922 [Bauhinia variegata]